MREREREREGEREKESQRERGSEKDIERGEKETTGYEPFGILASAAGNLAQRKERGGPHTGASLIIDRPPP